MSDAAWPEDEYVNALQREEHQLSMPKFEVKTPTNLNEALKAEGLEVAYDAARADFSGLSSRAKADGLHLLDTGAKPLRAGAARGAR